MPSTLSSVDNDTDFDASTVTFVLNGTPEVHIFREDRSLMVDIASAGARAKAAGQGGKPSVAAASPLIIDAPETVPAKGAAAPAAVEPKPAAAQPAQPTQAESPPPPTKPAVPAAARPLTLNLKQQAHVEVQAPAKPGPHVRRRRRPRR